MALRFLPPDTWPPMPASPPPHGLRALPFAVSNPARRGNRQLKRVLYLAAFASLKQPESRTYYDKKRRAGKHHVAAVIALARRRVDVLFAMRRDGTFYQAPASASA